MRRLASMNGWMAARLRCAIAARASAGVASSRFRAASSSLNDSEFAGACFSADGEILFVNVFGDGTPGSGMARAIWGPWKRGPL